MTSASPRRGLSTRLAGNYPLAETYHLASLNEDMRGITEAVSVVVPEATGIGITGHADTVVIDRAEWIDRNVAAFAHLTEPARRKIEEKMEEAGASETSAAMARRVVDLETRGGPQPAGAEGLGAV